MSLLGYRVISSEVKLTTLKYVLEDLILRHKSYDLMLGSSTVKRLNASVFLECGNWLNRGIGSSTIPDLNAYLQMSYLEIEPSIILLYAGENDISRGFDTEETIVLYKSLIKNLLDKYPNSDIHAIAIKPSPSRVRYLKDFILFNDDVEIFADKLDKFYFHRQPEGQRGYSQISFSIDGVHLSNQGYKTFTSGFNNECRVK